MKITLNERNAKTLQKMCNSLKQVKEQNKKTVSEWDEKEPDEELDILLLSFDCQINMMIRIIEELLKPF